MSCEQSDRLVGDDSADEHLGILRDASDTDGLGGFHLEPILSSQLRQVQAIVPKNRAAGIATLPLSATSVGNADFTSFGTNEIAIIRFSASQ